VAAGTQNQALSALLFLYREVLQVELPWLDNMVRAKRPQRLPTVLSQDEARRLLAAMDGRPWLIASLLYGTGMRLMVEAGAMTRCVEAHRVRRARRRQEADWRCASGTNPESRLRPPRLRAYRVPWHASIRAPRASSAGSSCSHRCSARSIRSMARSVGITSMTPFSPVR
jgi:integrase